MHPTKIANAVQSLYSSTIYSDAVDCHLYIGLTISVTSCCLLNSLLPESDFTASWVRESFSMTPVFSFSISSNSELMFLAIIADVDTARSFLGV